MARSRKVCERFGPKPKLRTGREMRAMLNILSSDQPATFCITVYRNPLTISGPKISRYFHRYFCFHGNKAAELMGG